ncbi:MAG: hypothetical protein HGA65_04140 [Oscillochloris sp.]|nr:hypothetical protein [Oscillochloris sp.]
MRIPASQRRLFATVILLLLTSIFPLFSAYRYPIFLNDDSYITFTYIKNIVHGNGFVFNHPPAVLGTTTPLFTITVAGLALIFPQIDIPLIAVYFTAICWLGIIWTFFFFRKAWRLELWQVCILALVVIGSGWVTFLGMEAYLFAFLLTLSISLCLGKSYWLTGLSVGLLFLTRGEGALVFILLSIVILVQQWASKRLLQIESVQNISRLFIGFMLPFASWAIYARLTFGTFLPNTLAAKQMQAQSGLWQPFFQRLVAEWITSWGQSFTVAPFVNLWWILICIGCLDALRHKHEWLIVIGWIAMYISGYSLLGVSAYWWYQIPILFVLNLCFGLGIIKVVELFVRYIQPFQLALGIAITSTLLLIWLLAKPTINAAIHNQGDSRGESYVTLSRWFREHTQSPSESIAFIEIGYLGYYTDHQIIDLAGLTSPDALPHIANGDFTWVFWQHRPDYYVYSAQFDALLAGIRTNPEFDQLYKPVATLPGPREVDLVIYKRFDP